MHLSRLSLVNWRSWREVAIEPAHVGVTVLSGPNGEGKTNLLEAVGWALTSESFRGAPKEALVRTGCDTAVVRLEGERDSRRILIEGELRAGSRDRVMINRQALRKRAELLDTLRVSFFSPDDLELVKGGPQVRRRFLDQAVVGISPPKDGERLEFERILRQRNMLLRQAGGRESAEIIATLDVWDSQMARVGGSIADRRDELIASLSPNVASTYLRLARGGPEPVLSYRRSWEGDLALALASHRREDLKRGSTTIGPHRDDLEISLSGMPMRAQASQGEQRCLALALRLAVHGAITDIAGSAPVLLLDDVFSELDEWRSEELMSLFPTGQVLLASASSLPKSVDPELVFKVGGGRIGTYGSDKAAG